MKETVKRIILAFICCLSILSLSGCYNRGIERMSNHGHYIKLEVPAVIDKDKIYKLKLYYGHDCDSYRAEDAYLNALFKFKLSIMSFDDDKNDEEIVIFTASKNSDYIADQSNRVERSSQWIWARITLKKYYDVEFAYSDYNYKTGQLKYEFSFVIKDGSQLIEPQMEITKNFKTNQSTVYFFD